MLYVKEFSVMECIYDCSLKEKVVLKSNFKFLNSYKLQLFESNLLKFFRDFLKVHDLIIANSGVEYYEN